MSSNLPRMCFASRPSMMPMELRKAQSCRPYMQSPYIVFFGVDLPRWAPWRFGRVRPSWKVRQSWSRPLCGCEGGTCVRDTGSSDQWRDLIDALSRGPSSVKMQGARTDTRPKEKVAKGASDVVVEFLPIVIFGRNLRDKTFEIVIRCVGL